MKRNETDIMWLKPLWDIAFYPKPNGNDYSSSASIVICGKGCSFCPAEAGLPGHLWHQCRSLNCRRYRPVSVRST